MRQLSKQFGANQILNSVSFDVAEGEFCILLGPSGCGKSTVLRLIAGLEQPTEGSIVIDGKPVDHLAPRDRDIAFVFQSYALYPHMTVFENLAFSLRLRRAATAEIESKVRDAAQLLEIDTLLGRRPQEFTPLLTPQAGRSTLLRLILSFICLGHPSRSKTCLVLRNRLRVFRSAPPR